MQGFPRQTQLFVSSTHGIPTKEATATAAAQQKWQQGLRQDIDYENLTAADYAAMEADLQARPVVNQSNVRHYTAKLALSLVVFIIIIITKLIKALTEG